MISEQKKACFNIDWCKLCHKNPVPACFKLKWTYKHVTASKIAAGFDADQGWPAKMTPCEHAQ